MNHEAKLIVFDWDGTLMNSEARIVDCLRASIRDVDLEHRSDDELKNIIGLGLREALETLFPNGTDQQWHDLTERYRYHFLGNEHEDSQLFAGARELIEDLHKEEYFLAIATGKARRGLTRVLGETGLGDYFHFTRCADETHSKPHPQMLLEIIDWYGVDAKDTIMIGDTDYDLQMANNAAAHSVGVTYGVQEKQRLLDCQPLTCVDNINDLSCWLLNEQFDAISI